MEKPILGFDGTATIGVGARGIMVRLIGMMGSKLHSKCFAHNLHS